MPIPDFYTKKYHDILAIEPKKDPIYPVRIFKQLEDDPMNNLIDSIAKVNQDDNLYLLRNVKPVGNRFNKKAKEWATGLYRNDKTFVTKESLWKKVILAPVTLVKFLVGKSSPAGGENELKT